MSGWGFASWDSAWYRTVQSCTCTCKIIDSHDYIIHWFWVISFVFQPATVSHTSRNASELFTRHQLRWLSIFVFRILYVICTQVIRSQRNWELRGKGRKSPSSLVWPPLKAFMTHRDANSKFVASNIKLANPIFHTHDRVTRTVIINHTVAAVQIDAPAPLCSYTKKEWIYGRTEKQSTVTVGRGPKTLCYSY